VTRQVVFMVCMVVYLCMLWVGLVFFRDSPIFVVGVALNASPIALLILRLMLEDGRPRGLFNWETQSWAFLFGDTIGLPLALGAAAYGQRYVPDDSWFRSGWYLTLCVVIGVLGGTAFRFLMEVEAYTKANHASALMSPTKLTHDFVSYPLLLGGLMYLGLPVLVYQFRWVGVVALLGVAIWLAMCVRDAVHPPKPTNLHPGWMKEHFAPIPEKYGVQFRKPDIRRFDT